MMDGKRVKNNREIVTKAILLKPLTSFVQNELRPGKDVVNILGTVLTKLDTLVATVLHEFNPHAK